MLLDILLLAIGLAVIVKSADFLINSASGMAKKLGIPIFVVGIIIVAFGTSTPELVIGIMSGVTKTNELTLGNIIGSGFSNIALILGVSAIILPLKTEESVVKKEIPILIGVELLFFGLLLIDNDLSLIDGIILVVCFAAFVAYIVIKTKLEQEADAITNKVADSDIDTNLNTVTDDANPIANEIANDDTLAINLDVIADVDADVNADKNADMNADINADKNADVNADKNADLVANSTTNASTDGQAPARQCVKTPSDSHQDEKEDSWKKIIIMLIVSLVGLFIGGKLTVDYSAKIALSLGLTETFIGITIVAIATTLPEFVASLTAVRRKEAGIVLGNCIGSNIFNILLVLGGSAIINPIEFSTSLILDICLVIILTVAVFFVALSRRKISRNAGFALVLVYVLYMVFKVLEASAIIVLPAFLQ